MEVIVYMQLTETELGGSEVTMDSVILGLFTYHNVFLVLLSLFIVCIALAVYQ